MAMNFAPPLNAINAVGTEDPDSRVDPDFKAVVPEEVFERVQRQRYGYYPLPQTARPLMSLVCAVVSRDDKTLRDLLLFSISTFTWVFW